MTRVVEAWNRFWFLTCSPLPVCIYRIWYGSLVFVMGAFLAPDLQTFFGRDGILSPETAHQMLPSARLDVIDWLNDDRWLVPLWVLFMAAALCLAVGFCTRASALLVYLGLVSMHHRNEIVFDAGDNLLRIYAFYLIFSQAGATWSVDRLLQRRDDPPSAAPWAQRLMQVQLSVAYIFALWTKLQALPWVNGTAVYYVTRLQNVYRFPVPILLDHLWGIRLLTWGTLIVEASLGFLIWIPRLRYWVLAAGLALHLGLEFTLNIPWFQWIMMGSYILFIKPEDLQRWLAALRGGHGKKVTGTLLGA